MRWLAGISDSMNISLSKVREMVPGGPVVKNLPANSRGTSLTPGPGRFSMPWGTYTRVP